MNPFIREKRDGRRAPGYLVYVLAGGAAFAAVAFLHSRTVEARPQRVSADRGARISPITQAASSISPVKVERKAASPQERSFRLASPGSADSRPAAGGAPPARDSFDAIGAALAGAPPGAAGRAAAVPRTPLDTAGGNPALASGFAALPPAFADEAARGGAPASKSSEHPELLGYRDPTADILPRLRGGPELELGPKASGFVVPKGTLLRVCLLTTADTSNPSSVIQFGIASDLVFNRRRQLDFGTRLLGRLSGRPARGRLNLVADTVLFPDGLELPVSAVAVEADDIGCNIQPGVAARHIASPEWVTLTPYASELFTGTMAILAARANPQVAVGLNGVSVQTNLPDGVRGPAYQASEQAIQDFTEARLKELEERYAAYDVIPAGTACCLQLSSDLDLGAAHAPRRGAPRPPETHPDHAEESTN
ncbi:MAG: hypothetical protein ABSA05_07950 [Opitutaceae bacterium]|jgi:hypothetical protein